MNLIQVRNQVKRKSHTAVFGGFYLDIFDGCVERLKASYIRFFVFSSDRVFEGDIDFVLSFKLGCTGCPDIGPETTWTFLQYDLLSPDNGEGLFESRFAE